MTLPASFSRDGFTGAKPTKFRKVLIGTEGAANTGKTEFLLSAPGPGILLALDRSYDATLENPAPPDTRRLDEWLIQPVRVTMPTACTKEQALEAWRTFYRDYYCKALDNADCRSVALDGDSDSFELQMLAEFGRTTQIPQIQRTSLNAARRAMIARAWDSGKVVIATNKLKKKYENVYDAAGNPVPDPQKPGEQKREWDGKSYERQGFNDHEYLWQIQLRHLYNRERHKWGIQILMCKANRALEGDELWGSDCNVRTLLEYVYPHIPAAEWGYRD